MPDSPNIIVILADDLGYGDLAVYNSDSRIPTPRTTRLAHAGMRFANAHSTSAVCTPSRYSLLTGRYNWRSRLKAGIVCKWDAPLIRPDEATTATILGRAGYDTACIGKWHLGWDWPTVTGEHANETLPFSIDTDDVEEARTRFGYDLVDFAGRIRGGPLERGFDEYFGVDVPNYPPYAWIDGDRIVGVPSEPKPSSLYGDDGLAVPGWNHESMLPMFADRAEQYIRDHSDPDAASFFLYLALTAPHSPVTPNSDYAGASEIGAYGDLVAEIDALVGRLDDLLDELGMADNTLVVFSSDNGPELRTHDDEGAYERARRTGHFSSGPLRGIKHDAWEGGHRIPLIVRWPARVPAGSVNENPASLVDLVATFADAAGSPLSEGEAPDSLSMMSTLLDPHRRLREHVVVHSRSGKFGVLDDQWALIDSPTGSETTEPEWLRLDRGYIDDGASLQLHDLNRDIAQARNRADAEPMVAEAMLHHLESIRAAHADDPAEVDRSLWISAETLWPGA